MPLNLFCCNTEYIDYNYKGIRGVRENNKSKLSNQTIFDKIFIYFLST